jgi:ParB-like chromosome segregation protein Spo0J
MDEHGITNPIVVNSNYELQFGGCRLQYAVLNNLEYIDVIICDDLDELRRLQDEQSEYEYTFLPEHLIERKRKEP